MARWGRCRTLWLLTGMCGATVLAFGQPPPPMSSGSRPLAGTISSTNGLGFEVCNGQAWLSGTLMSAYRMLTNPAGGVKPQQEEVYEAGNDDERFKLRFRSYKLDEYTSFQSLQKKLNGDDGWEEVKLETYRAMKREGLGNGDDACRYDLRIVPRQKHLVQVDVEGPPDCSLSHAYRAVEDQLETFAVAK